MRFALLLLSCFFTSVSLSANETPPQQKSSPKRFEAFTGKVTGNHVRMRMAPNLDAQVFKELNRDDLVLITGIVDDFYACMPPKGLKGYIFRTYVLDGVVEGSNVFVRLGPDRSAHAVCALNSGDMVKGNISSQNSKWLEIELPAEVRFYVAKEYIKQVGDSSFFDHFEARKIALQKLIAELENKLEKELQKPFLKIQLAPLSTSLTQIINDNKDMPQIVSQAESLISRMQESYLAKSVAHSDAPPVQSLEIQKEEPTVLSKPAATSQPMPKQVEKKIEQPVTSVQAAVATKPLSTISWQDREQALVQVAINDGIATDADSFYKEELKDASTLHGTIKPYNSFSSSRPGDFVLLNLKTNLPIAYLYSTKVDLAASINKPVTIWVSNRPNNNFAFPAYHVLQIEE